MTPSSLMLDFGRPIAFYPGLVKHFGSVNAALFFCQIFYWQDKTNNPNGVYKESAELEQETGMTYREQQTARKKLRDCGVLIETNKRLEHRIYYKIDVDRLNDLIESANQQTSSPRNDKSAVRGGTNEHFVLTEITTEITTENKPQSPAKLACSCPVDEILRLWKKVLPEKRQPVPSILKQGQTGKLLNDRWNQCMKIDHSTENRKLYHDEQSGLEFWEGLFNMIRQSEFLMSPESKWFTFAWLVKKANFEKLLSGDYQ